MKKINVKFTWKYTIICFLCVAMMIAVANPLAKNVVKAEETPSLAGMTVTHQTIRQEGKQSSTIQFDITLDQPVNIDYIVPCHGNTMDTCNDIMEEGILISQFEDNHVKYEFKDYSGGEYYFQFYAFDKEGYYNNFYSTSIQNDIYKSEVYYVDNTISIPALAKAKQNSTYVYLNWQAFDYWDNYRISRATTANGPFTIVEEQVQGDNAEDDDDEIGCEKDVYNSVYTDTTAKAGTTYFYKIELIDDGKAVGSSAVLSVEILMEGSSFTSIKETKFQTFQLKWKKKSNCIGYLITGVIQKRKENVVMEEKEVYRKVIDNKNTNSLKLKKYTHGGSTIFRIQPIYNVNGVTKYGLISESYAQMKYVAYYAMYDLDTKQYKCYKWPRTAKEARKQCKTITVKTWEYKNHSKRSGGKYTKKLSITVNKHIAKYAKRAYKKIYKHKSKPVIYEAGSLRWRPSESNWSYHTIGCAIDMNCNENPMYGGDGNVSVGSFFRPKTNAYSFPINGVVEKSFKKYGFSRLGFDLMHFQYPIIKFYDKDEYNSFVSQES